DPGQGVSARHAIGHAASVWGQDEAESDNGHRRGARLRPISRPRCALSPADAGAHAVTDAAPPHRIDVHHHILPPAYVAAVGEAAIGSLLVSGRAPRWTPQASVEAMDRNGIATAITSM